MPYVPMCVEYFWFQQAGEAFCGMALSFVSNYQGVYRNLQMPALVIGGVFVLTAVVLSCHLILQHLKSYNNPAEQKWIIGVLFMVPFYACESIISLWNSRFSVVCDILRNCYEAFALYCFGSYLVACLGGERRVLEILESRSQRHLSEPFLGVEDKRTGGNSPFRDFFCHPVVLGEDLYTIVKFGIVQYMILKTLCAFLALVMELFGVYGDGEFQWYYGYPYLAVVLNFSQMWALYCLVQFYNATHQKLKEIKPLAKFISFKAIVFATWWQGVGIAIICYLGVLPGDKKIQNGIQDFLICVEMAIAAVAHIFVFPPEPYRYLPISEHGKVTTEETKLKMKVEGGSNDKSAVVEEKETRIEAPGTSVTESVQDVVLGGGGHVVKDVVLTINQAVEPVEKGVTKIQETFHQISAGADRNDGQEGSEKKGPKVEVEERIEEDITESGPHLISSERMVKTELDDSEML